MLFRLTLFVIAVVGGYAQSTEGAIIGVVKDEVGGQGLEGVQITAVHRDTGEHFQTVTSFGGSYVLLRLAPGLYDLSAELDSYRPARIEHLDLPVTGLVHQNVSLRRYSDLFQRNLLKSVVARDQKTVLMFYGPDVDMSRSLAIEEAGTTRGSLEPSISQTVDPQVIDEVPLAGRDAYQLLTLMPGVASGLATLRGVSVAVNGQRPSSSSFLLDGVENNNYLVT